MASGLVPLAPDSSPPCRKCLASVHGQSPPLWTAGAEHPAARMVANLPAALDLVPQPLSHPLPATQGLNTSERLKPLPAGASGLEEGWSEPGWEGGGRRFSELAGKGRVFCPAHFLGFHCRKSGTCLSGTLILGLVWEPQLGRSPVSGAAPEGGGQGCWAAGEQRSCVPHSPQWSRGDTGTP